MTSGCNTSFWKRANTHFERYYSWWARWNSWQNLLIHSDIYRHQLQTRRIHHHLALLFRSSLFQWFIFIIGVVFHRLENRIDQKLSQQHSYVNANGPIVADIWPIRWNHLWTSFFSLIFSVSWRLWMFISPPCPHSIYCQLLADKKVKREWKEGG